LKTNFLPCIQGKRYICRWKSISCVCTFICRQRGVSAWNIYTCWLTGYIAKLTKKKNGKRGNKLRKELKIKLSHYFSLQCASLETCILYKDIVLPFKLLLTLNQLPHITILSLSKYQNTREK
jgi:hypothetical protein